jgi:solute carrier family 25 (mitochondrial S-adenosylmethionine transporter), member 26
LSADSYHLPSPLINSAASATAEAVSCFILTPAEVLKQNAQIIKKSANEPSKLFDTEATIRALRRFKHPAQLWSGYTALVARNLPFTAMQFPVFEHLKESILDYRKRNGSSSGTLMERGAMTGVAAAVSGSFSAVITTPIDVIKTRIMLAAAGDPDTDSHAKEVLKKLEAEGKNAKVEVKRIQASTSASKSGIIAMGKEILRQEGLKGLFRGGALRGIWTALGSGLYLSVYESGRHYLESRRKQD